MGPSLFFRGHHQAAGCLRIGMGMTVMDSHQQRGARRAAILAAVAAGKHDALFGQTVDVRRFDNLLAVTAQHAHAQVIRVNEDNVGLGPGCGRRSRSGGQRRRCQQKDTEKGLHQRKYDGEARMFPEKSRPEIIFRAAGKWLEAGV